MGCIVEFFDKFKKKKETPLDKGEFERRKALVIKKVKQYITKANSDPKIKKAIRKSIDDFIDGDYEYHKKEFGKYANSNSVPKLLTELEDYDDELMFIISNDSQYMRECLSAASEIIINQIKSDDEINSFIKEIDFGDGDEGCIYVTLYK